MTQPHFPVLAYVSHSVSARGKIADRKVEVIQAEGLRVGDRLQRLICREHDCEALGALTVRHGVDEAGRTCGDRDRDVVDVEVFGVSQTPNFGVGAHGECADVEFGLGGPLAQRLT